MPVKKKRICVYCGSRSGISDHYEKTVRDLAAQMVRLNFDLVYGGGRVGLMGVLSSEVMRLGGQVFGVIPEGLFGKEVADTAITELQVVASMHERKALMEKWSDAFLALPGGWGTLDEFFEILTWAQIGLHQKPVALFNHQGFYDPLLQQMQIQESQGFVDPHHRPLLLISDCAEELLRKIQSTLVE